MTRSFHKPSRKRSSRRPRSDAAALRPQPPLEVTAQRLGAQGDAVAEGPDGPLYIPYALAGERLRVRPGERRGDGRVAALEEVLEPSPRRVDPSCPHFGVCGGCALQHMAPDFEAAWKREMVETALRQRGLDQVPVAPVVAIPPGTRRRAVVGYRKTAQGLVLGFKEHHGHTLVDIAACPVLRPEIVAGLPALRRGLEAALPGGAKGDLMIVAVEEGLDLRLDVPEAPSLAGREALAALAETLDVARLVLRVDGLTEPVAIRRPPTLRLGRHRVALPVGAFLQPSAEGEAALRRLVKEGLAGIDGPVADLFCGLGTFALPLADDAAVSAYDADASLIAALAATRRVRAVERDLFRLPLEAADGLERFAAVVFDPPRAGAKAQAEALARSGPDRLVAVSCNPATFARDARCLVDGGYSLERVTPVDQFVWSPHVELVAVFTRTG